MSHDVSFWEKEYYSHGFAVCEHSIVKDTTYCRFRDEAFEFDNGGDINHILLGRGPRKDYSRRMLHVKVSKLRKLKNNLIKRVTDG